jgi:hypothetical protein
LFPPSGKDGPVLGSRVFAGLALLGALAAAACGAGPASGSGHAAGAAGAAGCQAPVQEATDPRSTFHLFPGTPDPAYLSDPPTSGPHRLGPAATGVVTTPIQRSRQVAMLELGYVILQYRDLSQSSVAALGRLAGPLVTVAPAGGPLPDRADRVVATAWTWKQVCGGVDPALLTAFITAHRGVGFSHGGFGPASTTTTMPPAP